MNAFALVAVPPAVVTLSGPILAREEPQVLRATRFVRGVKEVNNQLAVHADAGNIPALQGTPQPLGAQTQEVLTELGFAPAEIEALARDKVIKLREA